MNLKIVQLDKEIDLPAYAHTGDAGLDLRTTIDFTLNPGERKTVPCGVALAIPEGYAGLVIPRSGLAAKHGISIVNAPGLIDGNYRGEIMAILVNLDPAESFSAKRGDRIAQLMITPVPEIIIESVPSLSDTNRGDSGFGSSGVI